MGLRNLLFQISWGLGKVIAPANRYSQYVYRDELLPLVAGKRRWLDIGCGHQLFASWMRDDQQKAIRSCGVAFGCDLDFEGMKDHPDLQNKCMASGYGLPYASGSMDIVSANMVLEHVDKPKDFLSEVRRVLSPGGLFVFHTPNRRGYRTVAAHMVKSQGIKNFLVWLLEGRADQDVFPAFYRLNDHETIEAEAKAAGLDVQSIQAIETTPLSGQLGPLVLPELFLIRLLHQPWAARYRACLITVLRRPMESA